MKVPNEKDVLAIFDTKDHYSWDLKVVVTPNPSGCVIRVKNMYNYVKYAFKELEALANLCETKNINIGDTWSSDGCDTCDYGSQYVVEFMVKPEENTNA